MQPCPGSSFVPDALGFFAASGGQARALVAGPGSEASITKFEATVGGYGKLKGKKVPFVEAPTSCSGAGWPFLGQFAYADGTKATVGSHIGCTIKSTPDSAG